MALNPKALEGIAWALNSLVPRQDVYRRSREYYGGIHERMIADDRARRVFGRLFKDFRLNLCKPVVDSLADRLEISSFSSGEDMESEEALEIWKRNRMRRRSGHVHLEAIAVGNAYVIVWPDPDGKATMYPQKAHEVAVDYSTEQPGKIVRAAKVWRSDERTARLTLYYPNRVERYVAATTHAPATISPAEKEAAAQEIDSDTGTRPTAVTEGWLRPEAFKPLNLPGEPAVVANPFGRVPVFHFANNADIGGYGDSELDDAIPVQDMLNYLAFNILVGSEFQAFRQRWATGIEIPRDPVTGEPINPFRSGPEEVWVAGNREGVAAQFGEFEPADLTMLDGVKRSAALDMAQVTQTPPHYFFTASTLVSGESQKTAEQKLDAKVSDRQTSFGDVWAEAMAFAIRVDHALALDGIELDANWTDLKPRNDKEEWEIAAQKEKLGVSKQQILRERGYSEEQIEQFMREKQELEAMFGIPGQVPGSGAAGVPPNGGGNTLPNSTQSLLDQLRQPLRGNTGNVSQQEPAP